MAQVAQSESEKPESLSGEEEEKKRPLAGEAFRYRSTLVAA
jgi:hypothetical protein